MPIKVRLAETCFAFVLAGTSSIVAAQSSSEAKAFILENVQDLDNRKVDIACSGIAVKNERRSSPDTKLDDWSDPIMLVSIAFDLRNVSFKSANHGGQWKVFLTCHTGECVSFSRWDEDDSKAVPGKSTGIELRTRVDAKRVERALLFLQKECGGPLKGAF